MDFKTYQNRLSQLSARFNLMVSLVFGLLISNILLASFGWYAFVHQRVEITPFFGDNGYLKSQSVVDNHYLSLMSENFIYSRLNVTPETVKANHSRLLAFVDGENYSKISKVLEKESRVIRTKKISSVFDISHIRTNPDSLTVEITGVLKRHVGMRALKEERLTYRLNYRYHLGRLSILSFVHTKEGSNE